MVEPTFQERLRESHLFTVRAITAAVLAVLALALVVLRLMHLQVDSHRHFTTLSQDNRVRLEPLPPTRGLIYDAKGVLLAENYPSFSLEITPEKVEDLTATIAGLAELIPIDEGDRKRFQRLRQQGRPYEGVPIRTNLDELEVARIAVNSYRFPGVDVRAELIRYYPLGEHTAHVLGYVGRINEEELKRLDPAVYAGTHYIGKGGVELAYESLLHGTVGYRQVEVNASGRVQRVLESHPPASGHDLHLYLDIDLQQDAAIALGDRRGAVVAIDPRTGGVLALVSRPSFDPNLFVEGIGYADYQALRDSPDTPLYNRAVRGQYPPGSTVKPFVALGGLELGVINAASTKFCPGFYRLPGNEHKYRDWRKGGHGTVDLRRAIVESCDVYFYDLAHDLGIDRLHDFMVGLGFGGRTGIDVAGELAGVMPSKEWKRRARKQPWFPGETLIVGIGQGSFLATPLQLAVATATLAARGRFIQPHVARAERAPGAALATEILAPSRQLPYTKANMGKVIDGMIQVVEGERGTAKRIRSPSYRIAGKTGTAQVFTVGQKERYREADVALRMRDHALFVAFAPVEDPRIAVAVIVENGGHGGSVAAPVAREVMDSYLLGVRAKGAVAEEDAEE